MAAALLVAISVASCARSPEARRDRAYARAMKYIGQAKTNEAALELRNALKADPRFQQWLHGGSAFKALRAEQPLAKSALPSKSEPTSFPAFP